MKRRVAAHTKEKRGNWSKKEEEEEEVGTSNRKKKKKTKENLSDVFMAYMQLRMGPYTYLNPQICSWSELLLAIVRETLSSNGTFNSSVEIFAQVEL